MLGQLGSFMHGNKSWSIPLAYGSLAEANSDEAWFLPGWRCIITYIHDFPQLLYSLFDSQQALIIPLCLCSSGPSSGPKVEMHVMSVRPLDTLTRLVRAARYTRKDARDIRNHLFNDIQLGFLQICAQGFLTMGTKQWFLNW